MHWLINRCHYHKSFGEWESMHGQRRQVQIFNLARMCVATYSSLNHLLSPLQLTEISSVTSIPPGILLQAFITNIHATGLNLQVLGYFDGTVDEFHLGKEPTAYKVGKKVKARVLYDHSSSPPKFALSLLDHVVQLRPRLISGSTATVPEAYPIGTVLEAVKVLRVEPERGLTAEVAESVEGFVHVSSNILLFIDLSSFFLSDLSSFGRSFAITFFDWSMETGIYTSCPRNRLFSF